VSSGGTVLMGVGRLRGWSLKGEVVANDSGQLREVVAYEGGRLREVVANDSGSIKGCGRLRELIAYEGGRLRDRL
jgi:hypothetical protein